MEKPHSEIGLLREGNIYSIRILPFYSRAGKRKRKRGNFIHFRGGGKGESTGKEEKVPPEELFSSLIL